MDDLFQQSPVAQSVGLREIMMKRQQMEQEMAKAQQDMELEKLLFPEKLKQQQLSNQTTEAQLPGVRATSDLNQDKARFSRETLGASIADQLKSYQGKLKKQDLDELMNAGQAYAQAGRGLMSWGPGGVSKEQAKKLLGEYYRDEFDNIPPQFLPQVLSDLGDSMIEAQGKYQQQMNMKAFEGANKAALEDKKIEGRRQLEEYRASVKSKLDQMKPNAQKDPKTARAIANQLFLAAQQEQDPDRKALLMEQANQFNEIAFAEIDRRAQATAASKPDLGSMGIATNPAPVTPSLPGAQPQAPIQNNPATADPNLAKLPQGTKALGNGIYQLPDGRKVKATQ